ncbi:MAG TPA: Hsp33 family molecular chaperone HslO [Polyangia bacterium]|nr:Hsp33 family molecular chaperone HslO [Polyangia bacterium]
MTDHDQIIRCLLENGRARVVAATATQTVREITRRHDVRGVAAVALGRAVTSGLLLATLTKDEEQVTLQILGNGPLGGITVDARSSGRVRGYLRHGDGVLWVGAAEPARLSLAEAVGRQGVVNVVRDLGLAQNYAGQTALQTGEIDSDVEHYLATSEQIDSVLRCDTLVDGEGGVIASAGLLVQTLPQAEGTALVEFIRQTLDEQRLSQVLLETPGVDSESLARRLLAPMSETLQILDSRPVTFACSCSRARAAATLEMLHEEDLRAMILEDNQAQVGCNFCGEIHTFSESELELIRRKRQPARPAS